MRYVCDAIGGQVWFSLENQSEADHEGAVMHHAVARYFEQERWAAQASYKPREGLAEFERNIALKGHVERVMPLFLTLRDEDGHALVTSMLSRDVERGVLSQAIIVGPANGDPYPDHAEAIALLGKHYGVDLPRETCFPYGHR